MRLTWTSRGWDDYLYWQEQDREVLTKLNALIRDTRRTPFTGLGKPEPLGGNLKGWWSRRITSEHRMVYRVTGKVPDQQLEISQCRWHYE